MPTIGSAKAYANNEIAVLAWTVPAPIPHCLGFEITRYYLDANDAVVERRVLPAWVPFKGQSNPDWEAQTTSVWPIQKLYWRDLTARKRRDRTERRPADVRVKYRIRALVPSAQAQAPVDPADLPAVTYEGKSRPLGYVDAGVETNAVTVTGKYGSVQAAFTNGILSAQWLRRALESRGETLSAQNVRKHMATPGDPLRRYLAGDVRDVLTALLDRAARDPGSHVRLALYELADQELIDSIAANGAMVRMILSNTSADRKTKVWDAENAPCRKAFRKVPGLQLCNRWFNNGHIGHNKFGVLVGSDGEPKAVMTGSTNWTPTGMCGQSNNAVIIDSPELAAQYVAYWDRLLEDTKSFKTPRPAGTGTANKQGAAIRAANAVPLAEQRLPDGTHVTLWCSPNTKSATKKDELPPDLAHLFSMMRKARDAILFACFLPSRTGKNSVIEAAIQLGLKDPSLVVCGAISDPTAMPNYVPKAKGNGDDEGADDEPKVPQPAVFDRRNVHVVRAAALTQDDVVGDFEWELLKTGNAIIHDKVVVVDPLSPGGFVALGSHNLGYKASYENDENLLIIRDNPALVQAYAVHVIDLYEHYRFRAARQELRRAAAKRGRKAGTRAGALDGFLSTDDAWLTRALSTEGRTLASYLAG